MSVKLVILRDNQDLIANVEEMISERGMVIGYYLHHPCTVSLTEDKKLNIKPWKPLSKDKRIPVASDFIVSLVDPLDQLSELYVTSIESHEHSKFKTAGDDEQPDVGDAD